MTMTMSAGLGRFFSSVSSLRDIPDRHFLLPVGSAGSCLLSVVVFRRVPLLNKQGLCTLALLALLLYNGPTFGVTFVLLVYLSVLFLFGGLQSNGTQACHWHTPALLFLLLFTCPSFFSFWFSHRDGTSLLMTWSALSWTVAEDLFSVFSRHSRSSVFALPIFPLLSCASSWPSPDFFLRCGAHCHFHS